jgi:competence ComEA-like helix-hairpin-helix protein
MNLTQSARRHDQPLRLGSQHGYRFEGDQVFINADVNVPPYFSGGSWSLELWACEAPHSEGPLSGVKVSEIDLCLPTPLAQHVHHVDTGVAAHLPPHGRDRAMVLALVERAADGRRVIQDFSNYGERQSFLAPHFEGVVGYVIEGDEVRLEAEGVVSSRPIGNLSGSLSLELWALPVNEAGAEGTCLAAAELPRLAGQSRAAVGKVNAAFVEPAPGQWQLALLLREWTQAHGYVTRDQRLFTNLYERRVPVVAAPVVAAPVVAAPVPAVLAPAPAAAEPVPAAVAAPAPVVEQPSGADGRRAVAINSASAEELAKVKGLNLKLAREIVKARPFASLNDLVKVRGIGDKTLQRLKPLLKL